MDKIRVLYLDDELNNLICFEATFRFDFIIFTATTIEEAYKFLANEPEISVVLSDQRMPHKTGLEFFEELNKNYPNPIHILITAYSEMNTLIRAINNNLVYKFISKPWDEDILKNAIIEADKVYKNHCHTNSKNIDLVNAYTELEKFAYSVSHDLRGPLHSIIGALEISRVSDSLSEVKEILGMMDDSVKKLDSFIKSIHEYYSIKMGAMTIVNINFEELIDEMYKIFGLAFRNNNIKFIHKLEQKTPFLSNIVVIKIILNNLLSNAIKYQKTNEPNKFVELNIEVSENFAIISVEDNGIGIQENHINHIYTMFYRATNEQMGSGFGLFNVKDALKKLNGEISVDSKFNIGTKFTVKIPVRYNDAK